MGLYVSVALLMCAFFKAEDYKGEKKNLNKKPMLKSFTCHCALALSKPLYSFAQESGIFFFAMYLLFNIACG